MIGPQLPQPAINPLHFAVINADNVVENVILAQPGFDIADKLLINVDVVSIGQVYDPATQTFSDPPALPVYVDVNAARNAVYDAIDTFTSTVTGRIPVDEKLAWTAKEDAARAIVSDRNTATAAQLALIGTEADLVGETIEALAAIVIGKANQYRSIIAHCTAIRRIADAALASTSSPYDSVVHDALASLGALVNGQ